MSKRRSSSENVELPAGKLESTDRDFTLRVQRGYREADDFARLTLAKGEDGYLVRLGDVARVELASDERRAYYRSNGEPNIGLGIVKTSTANSLAVARAARATAEEIQKSLPEGTRIFVSYDSTIFIGAAIERVFLSLIEAIALVIVVIYLFLGSARSAVIPAVTIPVCLVTAFAALWAFGFTINLLTLLAIVLCIGLVVDDAIVVVENIQRRADLGEPPLVAAKRGTAQVAFAVVATTAVLVSVFLPIGFMEGNTGRLFRELSVALASAVAISCFVALSLTPMMSSKLVRPHAAPRGLNAWIQGRLSALSERYRLHVMRTIGRPVLFGAVMLASALLSVVLFQVVPKELAPDEDRGAFWIAIEGPEGAGFDYTVSQIRKVEELIGLHIGDDGPIQRINTRVPGGFGAQRGDAHRPGDRLPAGLGQARSDDRRGGRAAAPRARRPAGDPGGAAGADRPGPGRRPAGLGRAGRPGLCGTRAVARPHARAHGGQSGAVATPTPTTRRRGPRCASTSTRSAPRTSESRPEPSAARSRR